ncbi:DUF4167 domain-containing protein [Mesorhizobium sp. M1005]|uniref:DUF4167 domain-containing protein n=1 Tax=unclassified Mesorhizobium TaxID=325217 RepID=UPI00333C2C1C
MKRNQRRQVISSSIRTRASTLGPAGLKTGNAHGSQKNYERNLELAYAQTLLGNRVEAENYYQHAEHYFRCGAVTGTPQQPDVSETAVFGNNRPLAMVY